MRAESQPSFSAKAVRGQLDRILASPGFARAERMRRFLRFAVEQSLKKHSAPVKEYAVALAVYDKPASFDPRIDPIVRVEASRLRAKLREYYADEGRDDSIVVAIRKGGYSAIFRKRRGAIPSARLSGSEAAHPDRNPDARHFYLKGRHYWNKRSPEAILRAMECFKKAIALDSGHAASHAGLADCFAAQAWFEMDDPESLWSAAERESGKALSRDASMAEALATLAFKKAAFDWKWSDAEEGFRHAISADPYYATARDWYGYYCLAPQRRLSAAMEEVMRACDLDPLSPVIGTHLGGILYLRRRHGEAIEQYQRVIELDPAFHLAYWRLAFALIELSRFDEGIRALEHARALGCSEQAILWAKAYGQAKSGNGKQAERILSSASERLQDRKVSPVGLAMVYSALKQPDAAFECLERALKRRASRLIHVKVEPGFDALKTDPRFIDVLRTLDLL